MKWILITIFLLNTVFCEGKKKHIAVMVAEKDIGYKDYQLEQSVPEFMKSEFSGNYKLSFIRASKQDRNNFPNIKVLKDTDLLVLAVRRRALPKEQFTIFKNFLNSGKSLVALRTSNHGFDLRNYKSSSTSVEWKKFDEEVLGGKNMGYHPADSIFIQKAENPHLILKGISSEPIKLNNVQGSLYKIGPLKSTCEVLMKGSSGKEVHPVAWINNYRGSKIFYTSLGQINDFKDQAFRVLLANAINWGLKK